jgi:hypothetical protein
MERQNFMLSFILDIVERKFHFNDFESIGKSFKLFINLLKQMNYQKYQSAKFLEYKKSIEDELLPLSRKENKL